MSVLFSSGIYTGVFTPVNYCSYSFPVVLEIQKSDRYSRIKIETEHCRPKMIMMVTELDTTTGH